VLCRIVTKLKLIVERAQVYDQNHATMQPILGMLRQMVNLAVTAEGFSHWLCVTVLNQ
jgi:hypothetical protein